jgi:hypothetical protein
MKIIKMLLTSLLVAMVIILGVNQFRLMSELDKYKHGVGIVSQQTAETQMMMHMFWEMAPREMERIAREVVREELGQPPVLKSTLARGSEI